VSAGHIQIVKGLCYMLAQIVGAQLGYARNGCLSLSLLSNHIVCC
jgi:hypothetical protein